MNEGEDYDDFYESGGEIREENNQPSSSGVALTEECAVVLETIVSLSLCCVYANLAFVDCCTVFRISIKLHING